MTSSIQIDDVTFLDRDAAGVLLASHPVVSMETMKRLAHVGLFSRAAKPRDLAIRLAVRRLDPHVQRVRVFGRVKGSGPIGDVREVEVSFRNGATSVVTAPVRHSLMSAAVGKHAVTWTWFARLDASGRFEPAGSSTLAVYTTVAPPQPPWGDHSSSTTSVPWLEALELACEWAKGSKTILEVKAAVTRAVHRTKGLRYDRNSSGFIQDRIKYKCGEFIETITGKVGQRAVGCFDVASTVCTFANLLGADLSEDKMQISDGVTKTSDGLTVRVKGIGWRTPRSIRLRTHEVAWMRPGKEEQPLWDAAFGFPDRLAINLLFSEYRKKLMAPDRNGAKLEKRCRPAGGPALRRRVIHPTPFTTVQPVLVTQLANMLTGWKHEWTRIEKTSQRREWVRSLWSHKLLRLQLMIEAMQFADPTQASARLKRMVADEATLLVPVPATVMSSVAPGGDLWDEAFANVAVDDRKEHQSVFYVRKGQWVGRVRSVGIIPASVIREAAQVAQAFLAVNPQGPSLTSGSRP